MPEGEWQFSQHDREEYVSDAGVIGYRGNAPMLKTWRNHMPALEIKNNIGDIIWNNYFKFCIIRNPFAKLVSAFDYVLKFGGVTDKITTENTIENFRRWIKNGGRVLDRDKYLINDKICVNYFIRYEELENGIKHACNHLNIPYEPERIPKFKVGRRDRTIPISHYYDEETIQIVSEFYQFELRAFGYEISKL